MPNPLPATLESVEIPKPILRVVEGLQAKGHQAYLVGGSIRDILRGMVPQDFDIATSATPDEVQQAFRKVIPTGIDHGTVTVLSDGTPIEVTTFRSEGTYLDGRRPSSVAFERDVDADLSRRDFTINAIAFDPVRRELRDPFKGQDDLQARIVRCVGTPADRFGEDGLRALRAVRFATVLEFELDPPTAAAIPATIHVFKRISRERIRDEVLKLLTARKPSRGIALLQSTGLLEAISPALDATSQTLARVDAVPPEADWRLASWLESVADVALQLEILDGLRLPKKTVERIALWLREPLGPALKDAPDRTLRRWLAKALPENLQHAHQLALAREADPGTRAALDRLYERLKAILAQQPPLFARDLALDGKKIMSTLGVTPGPVVGNATRFLMEKVLDEPGLNTPSELARLLQEWANSGKS